VSVRALFGNQRVRAHLAEHTPNLRAVIIGERCFITRPSNNVVYRSTVIEHPCCGYLAGHDIGHDAGESEQSEVRGGYWRKRISPR